MNDEHMQPTNYSRPPVQVAFKSYSKMRPEDDGFELTVTSEADVDDVEHTVELAAHGRLLARMAIEAGIAAEDEYLADLLKRSAELQKTLREALDETEEAAVDSTLPE